jgi:hypothetical protein
VTHSPEPWRRGHSSSNGDIIYDAEDAYVGVTAFEEDQKRVIACVNFCRGVSTDTLLKCTTDHPKRPVGLLTFATMQLLQKHGWIIQPPTTTQDNSHEPLP